MKVFNVNFCSNNRVNLASFNVYGEYLPTEYTLGGLPIVETLEEATKYPSAFVGWVDKNPSWESDNIFGLWKDNFFILFWAAKEYLDDGPSWWTEEYTMRSPEELERVSEACKNFQEDYKKHAREGYPARPGYGNWADTSFALRNGYYYADYKDGWPEYYISPNVLDVVRDVTLVQENPRVRHYVECFALFHCLDIDEAWECVNARFVVLRKGKTK